MGYTCCVCGNIFTRCAFLIHKSESDCFTAKKDYNEVVPNSSTLFHRHLESNSISNAVKVQDSLPETKILENGSLFMVVRLDDKKKLDKFDDLAGSTSVFQPGCSYNTLGIENKISDPVEVPGKILDNGSDSSINDNNLEDVTSHISSFELGSILEENISLSDIGLFDISPDILPEQDPEPEETINEEINDIEALTEQANVQKNTPIDTEPINTEEIEIDENIENEGSVHNQVVAPKGYTKKGNPRKRAAPRNKDEIKTKRERNKEKHKLQPPCDDKCKRKCTQKVTEERRQNIYENFWSMEENERKVFILGHVDTNRVKRTTTDDDLQSRRGKTFFYHLTNSEGERKSVCKTFLLTTLGFKKKNDMFVFNVLTKSQSGVSPMPDKRGRHPPHNLIDKNAIKEHILKYHPCISHYRREHAPNRRYLPTELSVVEMHKAFLNEHEGNDNLRCSYELYRGVISDMNIAFTKLGHEECEKCTKYKLHNPEHVKNNEESCIECQDWILHNKKYTEARKAYDKSVDDNKLEEYHRNGTVICSMDLQKVLMLPHMEQFKEAVFTRRIVLFNESFVPVGNKQPIEPVACIWHEAISGRKKEDITSALSAFIKHYRDAKEIQIWMDNCASQNKNWALFSFMVGLINSDEIMADKIVFKYFEPGHTFMSADQFHHQVNQQIKSKGKVYDFDDFKML